MSAILLTVIGVLLGLGPASAQTPTDQQDESPIPTATPVRIQLDPEVLDALCRQYPSGCNQRKVTSVPGPENGKIAAAAESEIGKRLCTGSNGCAYAVNTVVQKALGHPITTDIHGGFGTSAYYMALALSNNNSIFIGNSDTPGAAAATTPGTIIISPSRPESWVSEEFCKREFGDKVTINNSVACMIHGHVGICMTNGCSVIASNSDKTGLFIENFHNLASWVNYYTSHHLDTLFYNLR